VSKKSKIDQKMTTRLEKVEFARRGVKGEKKAQRQFCVVDVLFQRLWKR